MKKMLVMVSAALMSIAAMAQYYEIGNSFVSIANGMSTTDMSYYSAYIFENQSANSVDAAANYIVASGISKDNAKVIAYCDKADQYEDELNQIKFNGGSFEDGNNYKYQGSWEKAWLAVIYNDGRNKAQIVVLSNLDDSTIYFDSGESLHTEWSVYPHINNVNNDPAPTPEPTSGLLLLLGMAGLALKRRG